MSIFIVPVADAAVTVKRSSGAMKIGFVKVPLLTVGLLIVGAEVNVPAIKVPLVTDGLFKVGAVKVLLESVIVLLVVATSVSSTATDGIGPAPFVTVIPVPAETAVRSPGADQASPLVVLESAFKYCQLLPTVKTVTVSLETPASKSPFAAIIAAGINGLPVVEVDESLSTQIIPDVKPDVGALLL